MLYIDLRPGRKSRRRAWLTIWDKVKITRFSHKLMHRKRVTCELHDSYFRSMTIKTCHSKDGRSAYSDSQLWGDIEWVLNYYITQCTGNSTSLGIRVSETRCGRESQHPAESWTPGPPVEQRWRTGKKR